LPQIRFHDLRHTHATHLLSSGIHPKIGSERLGHSKVGTTLDLYSYVMPGCGKDAAVMVDKKLKAAATNAKRAIANNMVAELPRRVEQE
jgi:integrase